MAARPIWKGQLRFSLVSIPVEIFSATTRGASVSFRQIHKPSGKPVHYQKVVQGVGPVDVEDIWKGYEVDKDEYVLISPEEIEDIKLETRKTLELVQFVGACEIPPIYYDKPYYLAPQDELAEDAYRVLRDALEKAEKVGLGQLAMRGKEYLVAVKPCASGLTLETLHYEDEIRKTDSFFAGISAKAAAKDLLQVATELIDRKTAPFDPEAFHDRYREAIRDLVTAKSKGRKPKTVKTEEIGGRGAGNVVDLMAALKDSLEKTRKKPARASKGRKSA